MGPDPVLEAPGGSEQESELDRLRRENRRLAVTLGGFSAFMAARGMLEEAWAYVHGIHEMDDSAD